MFAGDREVAPLTVHLDGSLRVWRIWYAPLDPAGNGPPDENMYPHLTGRIFCVALESIKVGLRPEVNAAIGIDAVIQVYPGVVPMEDIAQAIILTNALRLDCLGIGGPGLWVIGLGFASGRGAVGNFGELALSLLLAPAHPLGPRLQFFQGGNLSCVRNIRLWYHGYVDLSIREKIGMQVQVSACCSCCLSHI